MTQENDYNLNEIIKISFHGMPYFVMPRYKTHYIDNDYEKFSLQLLKNNLDKTKVFLDIGAHYGSYSLFAAKKTGCKVYSIEPVNENFELLSKNIKINNLDKNIKTYNVAISDQDGEAEFNIPWASDSAGFYDHPNATTYKKQKVQVKSIDSLLENPKVDLIKIDTEGHEIGVLDGLKNTFYKNPHLKLIIELNPECLNRAGKSVEELLNKIEDLNKDIYIVDENDRTLVRISDQINNWNEYVDKKGYANLFCIPKQSHMEYQLFISHSPNLDGAERALLEQVQAFNVFGWLSHVIVPSRGPLQKVLIEKGISHSVVEGYSFWVNHGNSKDIEAKINTINIKASAMISRVAKHISATAIVNNSMVNPWGVAAAKINGIPLIWNVHEFGDKDHNLNFSYDINLIRKFILSESDIVFCCSNSVKRSLLQNSDNKYANVQTIYNLIDFKEIISKSNQKIEPIFDLKRDIKLSIIGTLKKEKGQLIALKAIKILREQNINAELLIIGEGNKEYTRMLKSFVIENGLNKNVKFIGSVSNPYPFIKATDGLLVCSVNEAFGRVTAEAMLLGVPVIGSDSGGTSELIEDNKSGYLYPPGNEVELSNKIIELIKSNNPNITKEAHAKILRTLNYSNNAKKMVNAVMDLKVDIVQVDYRKLLITEWAGAVNSMADYEDEHIRSNRTVRELEKQNEELQNVNVTLTNTLNNITNSKSWRLTSPLRSTKVKIKGKNDK